jgi:hypothetical protein
MKTLKFSRRARLLSGLGTLAIAPFWAVAPAQAQPDINNAPKADNPANRAPRGLLTPEQRMQERLRRQLQALGATQAPVQDAVIAYVQAETAARTAITTKGRQLQLGLRANALTDAQVAALLNDYQGAIEEDKARRIKAQTEFLKVVDLSKMPKLEATLVLMGIYGDGPTLPGGGLNSLGANTRERGGRGGLNLGGLGAGGLGGGLGGFGQATPNQARPTQPNIKTPVVKPAQV